MTEYRVALENDTFSQASLRFWHEGEPTQGKLNCISTNIGALQWDYVTVNRNQYIYFVGVLLLPGHTHKIKHHMMRRYLRRSRCMKSRLPIEARRYV